MTIRNSKYNSTKDLKITYYLGAGASYNAIPIWKAQGTSMGAVSLGILGFIDNNDLAKKDSTKNLHRNPFLTRLAEKIARYGKLAVEYGSIDIYARRLYLLGNSKELNDLKFCLSVYFDLWENFTHKGQMIEKGTMYTKVDKRYLSLLSVLLEKENNSATPKLNKQVSFISWNYDLQLEMSYDSFMANKGNSLENINSGIQFMEQEEHLVRQEILHLNGYRGIFKHGKTIYPNVEGLSAKVTMEQYLSKIIENDSQFKRPGANYGECIKYAWERSEASLNNAKQIMRETDILIVIGYSFPSFNRKIDSQLIKAFEESGYYDIIYQDPYGNEDIARAIFQDVKKVTLEKSNTDQFYVPHEFLFPTEGEEIVI